MIRLTSLSIAAAILATSLPAGAAPASPENVMRVSYRDLDLASATGQATLLRRLHRAADTLCFASQMRGLGTLDACRSDVMASARPSLQAAINGSSAQLASADAGTVGTRR